MSAAHSMGTTATATLPPVSPEAVLALKATLPSDPAEAWEALAARGMIPTSWTTDRVFASLPHPPRVNVRSMWIPDTDALVEVIVEARSHPEAEALLSAGLFFGPVSHCRASSLRGVPYFTNRELFAFLADGDRTPAGYYMGFLNWQASRRFTSIPRDQLPAHYGPFTLIRGGVELEEGGTYRAVLGRMEPGEEPAFRGRFPGYGAGPIAALHADRMLKAEALLTELGVSGWTWAFTSFLHYANYLALLTPEVADCFVESGTFPSNPNKLKRLLRALLGVPADRPRLVEVAEELKALGVRPWRDGDTPGLALVL